MKIEHVALWASNVEVLKDFYIKYFGAQASTRYSNEKKQFQSYFLSFEGGARLEVMQRPDIPPRPAPNTQHLGYVHIAISVGSDEKVDALTRRLIDDGFTRLDGPRRTGDGYYESVVLDPESNRIEITA